MNPSEGSAIVTGGASGLGKASAARLAAAGAKVVIVDLNRELGEAAAAEIGATFVAADVTDTDGVQSAIDAASALAPLRIAVSCAGIGIAKRTLARDGAPHELDMFERIIRVNLLGTFNVLRLCASKMSQGAPDADGQRGVIINTASVAAYDGQIGQIAYSASKGGVVGMTLPAARDLSKVGIRVATIAPGLFDTPLLASLPEAARKSLEATVPFPPRLGKTDEYAKMVQAIVENDYFNGEVVRLDASLRMAPK